MSVGMLDFIPYIKQYMGLNYLKNQLLPPNIYSQVMLLERGALARGSARGAPKTIHKTKKKYIGHVLILLMSYTTQLTIYTHT
jgi:hypothetical protein